MLATYGVVREESRSADDVSADIGGWLALNPQGQIVCMFDDTISWRPKPSRTIAS